MRMSDALDRLADMGYPFYHREEGGVVPTEDAAERYRSEESPDPEVEFREDREAKVHLSDAESGEPMGRVYIAPNHLRGSSRTDWVAER